MTQPTPPESTNNHRSEIESPSFVKRGKLWIPETVQNHRSLLQKVWGWTGLGEKKLWDVLQLLIVPTALALGAFYLQETAKQRDLQIADDRAKQETLNRYFDQISTLLFEKKLRSAKEGSEAQTIARARTLAALRELDGERKGQLIRFLSEAELIKRTPIISVDLSLVKDRLTNDIVRFPTIVDLTDADLSEANLSRVNLSRVDLSNLNLRGANLQFAFLGETNLKADLTGANLYGADLTKANLVGVKLSRVNLTNAYMVETDFYAADLRGVILGDLAFTTFEKALFCETTMPDGTRNNRDCNQLKQQNKP